MAAQDKFLFYNNILILLMTRVNSDSSAEKTFAALSAKPKFLAESGRHKGLECSRELKRNILFEVLVGTIHEFAAIDPKYLAGTHPWETAIGIDPTKSIESSIDLIKRSGLIFLPEQVINLIDELAKQLRANDFLKASFIANQIITIIYSPITLN